MTTLAQERRATLVTLVLVALNLVALNALVASGLRARLDLTAERAFSISPATERIIEALEDPVTITGYFSQRTHPKLAPLVPQIEDLLDEYASVARGKVRVEIVDPGEDEAVEAEATSRFGVRSTPFRLASKYEAGIVNAYFSLVVRMGDQYERYGFDDLIAVEALPDGDIDVRLRNLEYDLTRAIKRVAAGFRGPEAVFESLPGEVTLIAVFTPETLPEIFAKTPDAVREAARELGEKAGAKFVYREIDPARDPEGLAEVQQRFGTQPYALGLLGSGEEFFLHGYLVAGDAVEQLGLTAEDLTAAEVREGVVASLERRVPGLLRTVGLVVPDPALPPELLMQLQMQGQMPPQPPPEFEEIARALEREYAVERIDLGKPVAAGIDALLLIRPESLDDQARYHVDQYLMRGGRVVLATGAFKTSFSRNGLEVVPMTTGLEEWLAHFGVTIEKTLVLDDRNQPLPIPERRMTPFGAIETWAMEPYPYLVEVRDEGLVQRDVAARVDAVGIYWGSPVVAKPKEGAEFEVVELLRSSARSWTDDDTMKAGQVGYEVPPEVAPSTLAVALSGRFTSFYAGREDDGRNDVPLARSPETKLVVIGNAAFVSDFVARALGPVDGSFFPQNLGYVQNVIDWAGEDADLLQIRARGTGLRTIERLEPGQQATIEIVNYLVPVVVLAALAFWTLSRRRARAAGSKGANA